MFKIFDSSIYWKETEADLKALPKACLAEFIALMFFVVLAVGGAMNTLHIDRTNIIEIASSFGFAIMVIAQFIGPLSGAHINCAVTFALWIAGRISGQRWICYTISQIAGAFVGGLILWIIFGSDYRGGRNFASNSWDPAVFNDGQVFLAEILGTSILVFNVFATIDHPIEGGGVLGFFSIAMSVLVAHLFLVPIDGCSINPTRSFGPYLIAIINGAKGSYREQQYMFWVAPMAGAALTAILCEYGGLKPIPKDAGQTMTPAPPSQQSAADLGADKRKGTVAGAVGAGQTGGDEELFQHHNPPLYGDSKEFVDEEHGWGDHRLGPTPLG